MNKAGNILQIAAGVLIGISLLAGNVRGDADDKPAVEEKMVTEVPVQAGRITTATLHDYLTAYGLVEPEAAGNGRTAADARLVSPTAGVLAETPCAEGQRVKKGDLIFRLDSRAADLAVEAADKNLSRQQQLITTESTSPKALLDAEQQLAAARVQQGLLRVESPLDGVIVSYKARAGEAVDTTTVLAEVLDPERLAVVLRIPSAEGARVATGQTVLITAATGDTNAVTGTVSFISPQVTSETDTVLVRVVVPSPAAFHSGQFVSARIVAETRADRLAAPAGSVTTTEDGQTVVAVIEGDHAAQKPVTTGLRENGLVEVSGEGIKEGTAVVTEGAYALPKDTKVRAEK